MGERALSPFSTRRLFSREATFSFVGVAYHVSKCDADEGKSRFARKKSPSGKRALVLLSRRCPATYMAIFRKRWREIKQCLCEVLCNVCVPYSIQKKGPVRNAENTHRSATVFNVFCLEYTRRRMNSALHYKKIDYSG